MLDGLLGARLDPLPAGASQLAQARGLTVLSYVLLEEVELFDRDEEPVSRLIVDEQALCLAAVNHQPFHTAVPADAVVYVNHEVAQVERPVALYGTLTLEARVSRPAPVTPEDLVVGENLQAGLGKNEALAQEPDSNSHPGVLAGHDLLQALCLTHVVA